MASANQCKTYGLNPEEVSNQASNQSDDSELPHYIVALRADTVQNLSSNHSHTLMILSDGFVRKCVHNPSNSGCIYGNVDNVQPLHSKNIKAREVATGSSHSVVLTEKNQVLTWGKNDKGQLGRDGISGRNQEQPKLVTALDSRSVVQISCGNHHTLVLTEGGQVLTWGSNSHGQLGLACINESSRNLPEEVTRLRGVPVRQIAAGGDHSLVLSQSGTVYSWGSNQFGKLGLGNSRDQNSPMECSSLRRHNIAYISCGEHHSACLSKDGKVFTFGGGSHGQLGHGDCSQEVTPRQVMSLDNWEVTQIACGSDHTLAYVGGTGVLHVLGRCSRAQLQQPASDEPPDSQWSSLCSSRVLKIQQHSPHHILVQFDDVSSVTHMRTIYAGHQRTFVVDSEEACSPCDFRHRDAVKQILTLSPEKIQIICSLPAGQSLTQELENEIGTIFANPSCLNGSFLTMGSDEDNSSSDRSHGLDMNSVRAFFQVLKDPTTDECLTQLAELVKTRIVADVVPALPALCQDTEALRLYLILPECPLFDKPAFHSSVVCSFARSFLCLNDESKGILDSWWTSIQPSYFKRLVEVCRQCAQYLMQLPCSSSEKAERDENIFLMIRMLERLYKGNENNNLIDDASFIIPELKDMINIQEDYYSLCFERESQRVGSEHPILMAVHDVPKMRSILDQGGWLLTQTTDIWKIVTVLRSTEPEYYCLCYSEHAEIPKKGNHFSKYLFLFDAEAKSLLFQTDVKIRMMKAAKESLGYRIPYPDLITYSPSAEQLVAHLNYPFVIDQDHLVTHVIHRLPLVDPKSLKKNLQICFLGRATGQGARKEFFVNLFQELMAPEYGLFTQDEESKLLWFNPESARPDTMFHLLGVLCGLILYNSVPVDLHFPLALYKKLLMKPVTLDDLKELFPDRGRSFQNFLDYDSGKHGNMTFRDYFMDQTFQYGAAVLVPGGEEKLVDESNVKEYVKLCVDHILTQSVNRQFEAFRDGFFRVCEGSILRSFRPEELKLLAEGREDVDFSELERHTTYGGVYSKRHPTIILFWEVFHQMSLADKKKFLIFVTGSARIPIGGMNNINMVINPVVDQEENLLPMALTCYNTLNLPEYTTKERLQQNLSHAIQCKGFQRKDN